MRRLLFGLTLTCLLIAQLPAAEQPGPPILEPGDNDVVEIDQWLHGFIVIGGQEQPVANLHMVVVRHPDGSRTTLSKSNMAIVRALGDGGGSRMEMRQVDLWEEDSDGYLTEFRLYHDENSPGMLDLITGDKGGTEIRSSAVGRVADDEVVATLTRSGRSHETTLELPEGVRLMGMQALQRLLERDPFELGETRPMHSVLLHKNSLLLVRTDATLLEDGEDGIDRYRMLIDLMPGTPMEAEVDQQGLLFSMSMNMGFAEIEFRRAEAPMPLAGAELALTGVVEMAGPPPASGARNRYRLPERAHEAVPEDGFQTRDGELLVVRSESRVHALGQVEPYLKAERQLEIGDPALIAWVDRSLAGHGNEALEKRARLLTEAVRNHLTGDLGRGEATALEAFRERRGDCTEHANLLCAALRIAKIPARVEVGLVYAAELGGWGGHAWVSAYDPESERWLHLDAAYPGVPRSRYIRTGSTSNREAGGTNAMLDAGMGLVLGQRLEVVPEPASTDAE